MFRQNITKHDRWNAIDRMAAHDRRAKVEQEIRELSLAQVPTELQDNPDVNWPPEVLRSITRATLDRTAEIVREGNG